jgi:hypothetical protein
MEASLLEVHRANALRMGSSMIWSPRYSRAQLDPWREELGFLVSMVTRGALRTTSPVI